MLNLHSWQKKPYMFKQWQDILNKHPLVIKMSWMFPCLFGEELAALEAAKEVAEQTQHAALAAAIDRELLAKWLKGTGWPSDLGRATQMIQRVYSTTITSNKVRCEKMLCISYECLLNIILYFTLLYLWWCIFNSCKASWLRKTGIWEPLHWPFNLTRKVMSHDPQGS